MKTLLAIAVLAAILIGTGMHNDSQRWKIEDLQQTINTQRTRLAEMELEKDINEYAMTTDSLPAHIERLDVPAYGSPESADQYPFRFYCQDWPGIKLVTIGNVRDMSLEQDPYTGPGYVLSTSGSGDNLTIYYARTSRTGKESEKLAEKPHGGPNSE